MVLVGFQPTKQGREKGEDGNFLKNRRFSVFGLLPMGSGVQSVKRAHTEAMTDPSSPVSESQPSKTNPRAPYVVPFHAFIKLFSTVKLLDDGQAEILLGGHPLTLPVAASQRERLQSQSPLPEQIYLVRLWFRTVEGVVTDVELGGFVLPREGTVPSEADQQKLEFQIGGRIAAVNKEEGSLTLKIEPHSQGALQEPFTVEVWASLDLMAQLQGVGRTMLLTGEYRPGSGRLVVKTDKAQLVGKVPKKKAKKYEQAQSKAQESEASQ